MLGSPTVTLHLVVVSQCHPVILYWAVMLQDPTVTLSSATKHQTGILCRGTRSESPSCGTVLVCDVTMLNSVLFLEVTRPCCDGL